MIKIMVPAICVWGVCVGLIIPAIGQETYNGATIQALDKVTTRISTLSLVIDKPVQFGTLQITLKKCQKKPPEETPESAAYVEIDELFGSSQTTKRFSGWFFASSPALSALDHPVYDFWLIDCTQPHNSAPVTK